MTPWPSLIIKVLICSLIVFCFFLFFWEKKAKLSQTKHTRKKFTNQTFCNYIECCSCPLSLIHTQKHLHCIPKPVLHCPKVICEFPQFTLCRKVIHAWLRLLLLFKIVLFCSNLESQKYWRFIKGLWGNYDVFLVFPTEDAKVGLAVVFLPFNFIPPI